jgi:hypothetical protein
MHDLAELDAIHRTLLPSLPRAVLEVKLVPATGITYRVDSLPAGIALAGALQLEPVEQRDVGGFARARWAGTWGRVPITVVAASLGAPAPARPVVVLPAPRAVPA